MIYQLIYHGEPISEAITFDEALEIQAQLQIQSIRTRITEPWTDGRLREHQVRSSHLYYWQEKVGEHAFLYNGLMTDDQGHVFDYGAFHCLSRYQFEHRTREALNALSCGSSPGEIALPVPSADLIHPELALSDR